MISNVIMVGIVIFLAMTLVAGAQVREDGQHFFDINNSNALRGFWCLIVVLVHIPERIKIEFRIWLEVLRMLV